MLVLVGLFWGFIKTLPRIAEILRAAQEATNTRRRQKPSKKHKETGVWVSFLSRQQMLEVLSSQRHKVYFGSWFLRSWFVSMSCSFGPVVKGSPQRWEQVTEQSQPPQDPQWQVRGAFSMCLVRGQEFLEITENSKKFR